MNRFRIRSEAELDQVVRSVLPLLKTYPVACFYGEMGAGKTTLIKAICRRLGVHDAMSSPTFSIVNEYRDDQGDPVYHFDFYRIEEVREAVDIGAEEYFYSGAVCLIEWPELINELIPENHLEISIKLVEDYEREIIVGAHG